MKTNQVFINSSKVAVGENLGRLSKRKGISPDAPWAAQAEARVLLPPSSGRSVSRRNNNPPRPGPHTPGFARLLLNTTCLTCLVAKCSSGEFHERKA